MATLVSFTSMGHEACWRCSGRHLLRTCAHEWMGATAGYIPKKLSALLITEFRPVASICTKFMIFLKVIDIRLDHVTEDYGLIDDAQEGFRQGRSTKRQLAKLHCMLADQRQK